MITRQLIYAFIGYANYEVNRNNLKLFEKKNYCYCYNIM